MLSNFSKRLLFPASKMGQRHFSQVNFKIVDFQDNSWDVKGKVGQNVMRAGIDAGVPFEVACGGNAECCTCHLYVPVDKLRETEGYKEPLELEIDALDFAAGSTDESRLGCQMKITAGCEG